MPPAWWEASGNVSCNTIPDGQFTLRVAGARVSATGAKTRYHSDHARASGEARLRPWIHPERRRTPDRSGDCAHGVPAFRHGLSRGWTGAGGRLWRGRSDGDPGAQQPAGANHLDRHLGRFARRRQTAGPRQRPHQRGVRAGRHLRSAVRAGLVRSRVRLLRARASQRSGGGARALCAA